MQPECTGVVMLIAGVRHSRLLCGFRCHTLRHQRWGAGVEPPICQAQEEHKHLADLQPGDALPVLHTTLCRYAQLRALQAAVYAQFHQIHAALQWQSVRQPFCFVMCSKNVIPRPNSKHALWQDEVVESRL